MEPATVDTDLLAESMQFRNRVRNQMIAQLAPVHDGRIIHIGRHGISLRFL
jgi:hypothetical protein